MALIDYQAGEDFSAGGFLDEPGWYHLVVVDVSAPPTKRDGSLIDNGFFSLHVQVLTGSVSGQEEKTTTLTFFHPRDTDKDGGEFRRKVNDRAFLATGILRPEDKGKQVSIDLDAMRGRQIIAKLEKSKDEKYLQLAFSEIYHVDDPAVKSTPKSADALKLIPVDQRMVGSKAPPAPKPSAPAAPLDINQVSL